MKIKHLLHTFCTFTVLIAPLSAAEPAKIYYDRGHGGIPIGDAQQGVVGAKANVTFFNGTAALTADALQGSKALYLRTPTQPFTAEEKSVIVAFVKGGGSLCLVFDEEKRMPLTIGVNDLIGPFGLKFTEDTPYLHNCGAIAKAGEVNKADRELPYSGGRAIEGGTAFAWQLDKDGKPAQPFAAWKKLENGARVVVMAEGMASLFLGVPNGERLTGEPRDPRKTEYWGQDSATFMEEVFAWLVK